MAKGLKKWQGWLLFAACMLVVFVLGLLVSSLLERRAEVASVFNNRKTPMEGIVAQNEKFKDDFPREYETWLATEDTTFVSEFNGSQKVDVLEQRPNMVSPGGRGMPSRGIIIRRAVITMHWRICVRSCERVLLA